LYCFEDFGPVRPTRNYHDCQCRHSKLIKLAGHDTTADKIWKKNFNEADDLKEKYTPTKVNLQTLTSEAFFNINRKFNNINIFSIADCGSYQPFWEDRPSTARRDWRLCGDEYGLNTEPLAKPIKANGINSQEEKRKITCLKMIK
jgi:hypothetical protein